MKFCLKFNSSVVYLFLLRRWDQISIFVLTNGLCYSIFRVVFLQLKMLNLAYFRSRCSLNSHAQFRCSAFFNSSVVIRSYQLTLFVHKRQVFGYTQTYFQLFWFFFVDATFLKVCLKHNFINSNIGCHFMVFSIHSIATCFFNVFGFNLKIFVNIVSTLKASQSILFPQVSNWLFLLFFSNTPFK